MTHGSPQPLFFGPEQRPLFGWLHQPATPARSAMVICNPLGYEAVCAHRSIRHFAIAAADAGIATLRFDYDGAGDSAGSDLDSQRLENWLASIHRAVDLLKLQTGVTSVCLMGIRLGATLATVASAQRNDVDRLIAIAPVINVKGYLRELRALSLVRGQTAPPAWAQVIPDLQESAGFALTAATRTELNGIDLMKAPVTPRQVLVIDREELPGSQPWVEHLRADGIEVDYQQLGGYPEMMLDAHEARVPETMVASSMAWLAAHQSAPADSQHASPGAADPAVTAVFADSGGQIRETAGFLDQSRTLFGIITEPARRPAEAAPLFLLLNSGAVHHIGPNRLYVAIARQWAAKGAIVVRMDISGLGDSMARPGAPENEVYTPHASRDLAAAIESIRARYAVSGCHAIGLCSGAYHGYKSAVSGMPLDSVIAINPLTFDWRPGMSVAYPEHRLAADALRYRKTALQLSAWKKLFTGKVDLGELSQLVIRRFLSVSSNRLRDFARRLRIPLANDLGTELRQLRRQQTNLLFVFAAGEPGLQLLRGGGGSMVTRLQRRGALRIETVEGADHTFTPHWSRQKLIDLLSAHIHALQPPRH